MSDELDQRLRDLQAERLRPVPPRPAALRHIPIAALLARRRALEGIDDEDEDGA